LQILRGILALEREGVMAKVKGRNIGAERAVALAEKLRAERRESPAIKMANEAATRMLSGGVFGGTALAPSLERISRYTEASIRGHAMTGDEAKKLADERIAAIEAIAGERYPRVAERKAKAMREAAERLEQAKFAADARMPFNGFSVPVPFPSSPEPGRMVGGRLTGVLTGIERGVNVTAEFWQRFKGNGWTETTPTLFSAGSVGNVKYFRTFQDCMEYVR
jgi:hypothetical protein